MLCIQRLYIRQPLVAALSVILFSSLCIGQSASNLQPATPGSSPLSEELTKLVEAQRQKLNLPGVTVAVIRDRDIIYKGAFGYSDLAKKTPASLEQPQPIGSITKVFAATMLMQLAERGVVRLDDPVTKYVPEYKVHSSYPNIQPTTLRQLASHTSGLPRDAGVNFWMNYTLAGWVFSGGQVPLQWYVSKDELLRSLPTVELDHEPNSGYYYSNLGICLLAIALERAAGVPYEQYVETNILKPLGMTHSGFISDSNQGQFPVGYVYIPGSDEPLVAPKWKLGAATYTGGIYATAEDLVKFVSLQFQDAPVGGSQVISGDSLRAMRLTTGDYSGPDYSAGLGWWGNKVAGHHIITHNGGHLGYLGTASAMPDMKLGVVVLANRCNPMTDLQTADLARSIFEFLVPRLKEAEATPSFDAARVDLQAYQGTYAVPGNRAQIRIDLENGRLYRTVVGAPGPRTELFAVKEKQFSEAPGKPATQLFYSDASGKITGLSFALFRFDKVN
jgi:CubicO group peptidase (beta-lactamase class C family)